MKKYFPALLAAVGVAALIVASVTTAQPRPSKQDEDNTLRLKRGEQYLVHASQDTVLELWVDLPISEDERLTYTDIETGKSFLLPNGANVRLQGTVVVGRDEEGGSVADPLIRWRYVQPTFARYDRTRERSGDY